MNNRFVLWTMFYCLVVLHMAIVVAFIASFFVIPFYSPWYQAVPTMVFIWFFSTTKVECKLTTFENYLRKKLGMRRIGGFVGFYIYRPIKKMLGLKHEARFDLRGGPDGRGDRPHHEENGL